MYILVKIAQNKLKESGYDSKVMSEEFKTKNEAKHALLKFKKKDAVGIHIIEVELTKS